MTQKHTSLAPLEFSCKLNAKPAQIFRALTSQNELRKWWAPCVVISRNKVSQQAKRDVEMKRLASKSNEFVRYSWRPMDWNTKRPSSIIHLNISDLGLARQSKTEGFVLEVIHDGWVCPEEKKEQDQIWTAALKSLKHLLEKKKAKPWWLGKDAFHTLEMVDLLYLKNLFEEKRKKEKRKHKALEYQNLWRLCNSIEALTGTAHFSLCKWSWDSQEGRCDFYFQNKKLISLSLNYANLSLFWQEWESIAKFPGYYLQSFKDRLSVEQDIDLDAENQRSTSLPLSKLQTDLWLAWYEDFIREAKFIQKAPSYN